ncbi:hypothetical protein TNCV_2715531 [Trichonephila clavipes]|nr:hypothetical protein TNCV_2715531 [Trichonephila clavipes]
MKEVITIEALGLFLLRGNPQLWMVNTVIPRLTRTRSYAIFKSRQFVIHLFIFISETQAQSLPQPDDIGYVIEGILHFARQINLEMDSDDAEELLDSQNQELTIDEFIEINDEELESLDPVFNQKIE